MVLVSNPHRFIFLKTSKTAGTTAEMMLEPACAAPEHVVSERVETRISDYGIIGSRMTPCISPPQPAAERGKWCNHKTARRVREDLGATRFDAYTKITTVRNPFDKCVSDFHWSNRRLMSLVSGFKQIREAFIQFIAAREWATDEPIVFINGRYIIDRAIRFEHLASDLGKVANDLGIPLADGPLPHTKATRADRKSRAVADYYDPESIDIVRERLSWVFERFPYSDHPPFAQEGPS